MAVVQISRIQHRRGRKNQGSGLPQLASGEIGWAIDTQEVYIGNGAVSEGAPAVGNTKILTEADDLLDLAGQYAYKRGEIQTGVALASPVERTVQAKLDDIVNVRDFGALGDGSDQTVQIQRAIDQLFINSATKGLFKSRITLYIPAGEYLISSPGLKLPPFANIIGAGIDKTVLNSNPANAPEHIFRTVNELSIPGTYADPSTTTSDNMARFLRLEGMSMTHNSFGGALYLENCNNSKFSDLKLSSTWTSANGITDEGVPASNYVGIVLSSGSVATATCDYNIFNNIFIDGFGCAVYSEYDINNNKFLIGNVNSCGHGFVLGADPTQVPPVGKANGAQYTVVKDYVFDLINKQGFYIRTGNYNTSQDNKYLNVGRDGGMSVVVTPVVEFYRTANSTGLGDATHIDMDNNTSINDYFQRTAELTVDPLYFDQSYKPEVWGSKRIELSQPVRTTIGAKAVAETLIRLPADQHRGVIKLDYTYKAEEAGGPILQHGMLTITYNKLNTEISMSDDHTFSGNPSKSGRLNFAVKGPGFQSSSTELWIDVVNTMLDELSSEADELEFTIKYIN
jgi:hypothetical protein